MPFIHTEVAKVPFKDFQSISMKSLNSLLQYEKDQLPKNSDYQRNKLAGLILQRLGCFIEFLKQNLSLRSDRY